MGQHPYSGDDEVPSVEAIRAAARKRARETSLRFAAREVGITATSLSKFIQGDSDWYGRTIEQLRAWYRREILRRYDELSIHSAATVVEMLLARVPPHSRRRAAASLLAEIARLHDQFGAPLPPWLTALRASYSPAPPGKAGAAPDRPDP